MILLDVLVNGPVCAISKRWPHLIHAADPDSVIRAWQTGATITATCGKERLRLLGDQGNPVLFPPPARAEIPRCRACWIQTGRKRPRTGRSLTRRAS